MHQDLIAAIHNARSQRGWNHQEAEAPKSPTGQLVESLALGEQKLGWRLPRVKQTSAIKAEKQLHLDHSVSGGRWKS